jgi:hypothetical protein
MEDIGKGSGSNDLWQKFIRSYAEFFVPNGMKVNFVAQN